jgi:hypothetical protein
MSKEVFDLTIIDPVGMGWLEICDKNGFLIGYLSDPNSVVNRINFSCCKKCDDYRDCGGVQYISQPYNRLERINSEGNGELVRSGCPLNGKVLRDVQIV